MSKTITYLILDNLDIHIFKCFEKGSFTVISTVHYIVDRQEHI